MKKKLDNKGFGMVALMMGVLIVSITMWAALSMLTILNVSIAKANKANRALEASMTCTTSVSNPNTFICTKSTTQEKGRK